MAAATTLAALLSVCVVLVDVSGASDDVSLSSLKATLDQQATVIQRQAARLQAQETQLQTQAAQLQAQAAQLTVLQDKFSALSASQHKRVAFSVTFPYVFHHALNIGTNAAVKFDTIVTNEGSGYSPQTGIFTAPFAGIYAFYLSLRSPNDHNYIDLGIYKGNETLVLVTAEGSGDANDRGSGFVTTHLRQGEQVYVRHISGDTYIENAALTTFSGLLVSPD